VVENLENNDLKKLSEKEVSEHRVVAEINRLFAEKGGAKKKEGGD